ncbi:MAG: tRNA (5-methylaminomethyl-2-thiouridine)(34)-methyltransferase MnmD [Bacteroidetes bacterium]|nr:tRNA (5-methylaminomethyl-2-thiouridine)(34)-methyltransferase MnmD [Bacteroidota bacterium]
MKVVVTEDGSHTIFVEELNENYHSTFGAIQESKHIFIEAGLRYMKERAENINILEIGFGTGLNAILSLKDSLSDALVVSYIGLEPFPISIEMANKLNYSILLDDQQIADYFDQMHHSNWNEEVELTPDFRFKKVKECIQTVPLTEKHFNLVYFDAFAPDVNPELWTAEIFKKVYNSLQMNGVLMSYSVKGNVKRALKAAGFSIEKLPGPKGKREILRATRC